MSNQLAKASSPYLRQHADNPVHWQEWGDFAFAEARRRDLPIFLSIGYAACHWCHVMAHESFENEAIAATLNEYFVSIKVDREERPEVDAIYMAATQAMTGQGGWPMTVFLDHELKPFYAGTYFPPQSKHGLPGFGELLEAVSEAWRDRRNELSEVADSLSHDLALQNQALPAAAISRELVDSAVRELSAGFDSRHGGFGAAPKFPPSTVLGFLIAYSARYDSAPSFEMVAKTMRELALGGLYDQVGGGFARYCVDANWTIPHFEKMLYDNALLLTQFARWARHPALSSDDLALAHRITRELVRFLVDELQTEEGLFASAFDADSEGGEGAFYCFSRAEFDKLLGAVSPRAAEFFGVASPGNFEGELSVLTRRSGLSVSEAEVEAWRARLLNHRASRRAPARDDKAITAWNAFGIAGLLEAAIALEDPALSARALEIADALWRINRVESASAGASVAEGKQGGGALRRSSIGGAAGEAPATLEDYAAFALALQRCYAVTGDEQSLHRSQSLLDAAIARFHDGTVFSDTEANRADLFMRPRGITEQATPTGVSLIIAGLLAASELFHRDDYRRLAEQELETLASFMPVAARFSGHALEQALALLDGPLAIAVTTEAGTPLHQAALQTLRPGAVIAVGTAKTPEIFAGRQLGKPLAFVCKDRTCKLPISDPGDLKIALAMR